jgi:hypothetical protein
VAVRALKVGASYVGILFVDVEGVDCGYRGVSVEEEVAEG